jgi:hypothetical protein
LSDGLTFLNIHAIDHRNNIFEAELSSELTIGVIHTVSAKNTITDCIGNLLRDNEVNLVCPWSFNGKTNYQ